MKRVVLIVDNPLRDLDGMALLGCYLASKNLEVHLISWNMASRNSGYAIWKLNPNYVLVNYLRKNNQKLVEDLLDSGIRVGALDNESGVLPDVSTILQSFTTSSKVAQEVSTFFSWGRKIAQFLESEGKLRNDQLVVSGTPKLDWYTHPFKTALANPFPTEKSLILVNMNFPLTNPRFQSREKELEDLIKIYHMEERIARGMQDDEELAIQGMMQLVKELSKEFSSYQFIVRPHPFEDIRIYEEYFKNSDNIEVVKKGNVVHWINIARLVIQRSCSTAVESLLLDTPSFSPQWIPVFMEQPTAERVSVPVHTQEELKEAILAIEKGSFEIPTSIRNDMEEIAKDWFHRLDGEAHKRIGDKVVEALTAHVDHQFIRENCGKRARNISNLAGTERWRTVILNLLNLPPKWSFAKFRNLTPDLEWDYGNFANRLRTAYHAFLGRRILNFDIEKWQESEKRFDHHDVQRIAERVTKVTAMPIPQITGEGDEYPYVRIAYSQTSERIHGK